MKRQNNLITGLLVLANPASVDAWSETRVEDRLANSALVVKEAMGMHSRIPKSLLDKAYCVIVIPSVIKGAFGFGGVTVAAQ
jgi:SH3 domain-containing YSC84-like protein 1